jgi:hypothetical protein
MARTLWGIPEYDGRRSSRIRLKVAQNPKRRGSGARKRFDQYRDGMTINDYISACDKLQVPNYALIDITWDLDRKFIELYD